MVVTVLAGLALLLTGCGAHYDFVIHDNETADLTYIMWDSSGLPLITRESCTEKKLEKSTPLPKNVEANYTYTSHNGHPACQVTAKSVPLNDLQTDVWTIKHQDGKYVFDLSPDALSQLGEDDSRFSSQGAAGGMKVSIAVTFPGEVTKSNGRNDDNKVTWDNVLESPEAPHAEGGDGKFHLLRHSHTARPFRGQRPPTSCLRRSTSGVRISLLPALRSRCRGQPTPIPSPTFAMATPRTPTRAWVPTPSRHLRALTTLAPSAPTEPRTGAGISRPGRGTRRCPIRKGIAPRTFSARRSSPGNVPPEAGNVPHDDPVTT